VAGLTQNLQLFDAYQQSTASVSKRHAPGITPGHNVVNRHFVASVPGLAVGAEVLPLELLVVALGLSTSLLEGFELGWPLGPGFA
jgi:hypothetical protein